MPDFRENFYTHYVSKFKGMNPPLSQATLLSYFTWCEYKFLPLFAGLPATAVILEAGCGPGYILEFLARHGFTQVQGIDISAEQVALARQRGYQAEVADIFPYLDQHPDTFAAILALDFVEHFHKEELLKLAAHLFQALQPGGRLILQTPNGAGLFPRQIIYGDLTHLTIFTPNSLQQLLRQAGFQEFRFLETGPVPKDLTGRLRVGLWRVIKWTANTIRRIETGKTQAIWTENMICYCVKPTAPAVAFE